MWIKINDTMLLRVICFKEFNKDDGSWYLRNLKLNINSIVTNTFLFLTSSLCKFNSSRLSLNVG